MNMVAAKYDQRHVPDLRYDLNLALDYRCVGLDRWLVETLKVSIEVIDDLMIGALPITVFQEDQVDDFERLAAIIPTGVRDGQHVIDLLATDGKTCWLRLETATWLGSPDGIVYTRPSEWLQAGGRDGGVYLPAYFGWL
ncbi:MAG: hypothetical protein HOH20_12905 [Rhodospirillaceae bacterium]|jgi:hypothetical protein|nr:hypothetical protein [Rhodospirillaceae bacterium]MBT6090471.1 hypothetical protein [Rhodospirillaceae bacterium]